MTDHTRSKNLARTLQDATGLGYAQALRLVREGRGPSSHDMLEGPGYDNLAVHRIYQETPDPIAHPDRHYLVFEMSQQIRAAAPATRFVKAVRFGTPRAASDLLASQSAAFIVERQRDILAAFNELGFPLICVLHKTKSHPLLFVYGAQGIADTAESAIERADDVWVHLDVLLQGSLEATLAPLSTHQVGLMVVQEKHGSHLAMVRGRPATTPWPRPTAPQATALEKFLIDPAEQFTLTLIASPINAREMTAPLRRLAKELSETRASMGSTRTFSAGVAIPLTLHPDQLDAQNLKSGSFGVVPQPSKADYDRSLEIKAGLLEAQLRRYTTGAEDGAFFYQMFLTTRDRETLVAAHLALRDLFGGAQPLPDSPQPLSWVDTFDETETKRLYAHVGAFAMDRCPETSSLLVEPFKYSTYVTLAELAEFTHVPRAYI